VLIRPTNHLSLPVNEAHHLARVRVVRLKPPGLPRYGRGPAIFAWVNTPSPKGGLPRGLHDHYFPSTKCPPDVRLVEYELAFMHASPYEVSLLNRAVNGLAGLPFNLITK
jgi:hypothetical protein